MCTLNPKPLTLTPQRLACSSLSLTLVPRYMYALCTRCKLCTLYTPYTPSSDRIVSRSRACTVCMRMHTYIYHIYGIYTYSLHTQPCVRLRTADVPHVHTHTHRMHTHEHNMYTIHIVSYTPKRRTPHTDALQKEKKRKHNACRTHQCKTPHPDALTQNTQNTL